ncbi:hypothetical protein PMAYCL1PPCAC_05390, partial [Pristionchus mayeri]
FQLGHEPFPLTMVIYMRKEGIKVSYYLPNLFSYAKQLAESHPAGWSVLMTGFDAYALALITGRYTTRWTIKYLDAYYPEFGGAPEHVGEDERRITDAQSFRRALRRAIRSSAVRTVAILAARPFTVLFIRQIAQVIGGEAIHLNAERGLREMIIDEGVGGALSGVIPQLIGALLMIWSCTAFSFVAERALTRSGIDQNVDKEKGEKDYKRAQWLIRFLTPLFVPSLYPYRVVSTVMACSGSGLVVSFLPYNPTFNNWQDAYEYLRPNGLRRGVGDFFRKQVSCIEI